MSDDSTYWTGYFITAVIVFIGSWIYCIAAYGFLVGVGIGWLPSLIFAVIVSLFWPLIAVVLAAGVAFFAYIIFVAN